MDAEQVVEVMGDQGWGEGETILGDSASHADIEKEEGNDSSSDSNDAEWPIEVDMTHLQGNTVAHVPPPSLPRQAPRKRRWHRRKGRCKQDDGVGRVREAEENLPLRSYCSSQQVHREIQTRRQSCTGPTRKMPRLCSQGYWYRIQPWSGGEETAQVQNTMVELEG